NIVIFYTFSLILQGLTGYLLPEWVMKILAPAIAAVDSPFAVFFAAVFANLLWFTGIHGAVIVSSAILGAFFEHNIAANAAAVAQGEAPRSEEHTSELQSREKLVCRLLLEKKKEPVGVWYFIIAGYDPQFILVIQQHV